MYLKRAAVRSLGPIADMAFDLPFTEHNLPKPVVLVGGNGSGKTNFLSLVCDALFEGAAHHYQNVTPTSGSVRPWFRVVGTTTVSVGSSGGFAVMHFEENEEKFVYHQKAGTFAFANAANTLPADFLSGLSWSDTGNMKSMAMTDTASERIFRDGVYVYFPSSRFERPDWLNRDSVNAVDFDVAERYAGQLRNPIYVESGIASLKQWLIALSLDARVDLVTVFTEANGERVNPGPLIAAAFPSWQLLQSVNTVLRIIMDDDDVALHWGGRGAPGRLVIKKGNDVLVPSLESLSTGQITLFNVFATLLRNGELRHPAPATGICLIDEIDAHIHIDLQYRALPKLMKLFPHIQFIVSSHSPLFTLGMAKEYGDENVSILTLPSGLPIPAEAYAEFNKALEVVKDTVAFNKAVAAKIKEEGPLLVLLEGETDPLYFNAAMDACGMKNEKPLIEFKWIGANDLTSGQGFHTGKAALNSTRNLILSKPGLMSRRVVLLYDNDANKADENYSELWVRSMPTNPENATITKGIENLLPERVLTENLYQTTTKDTGNGNTTTIRTLRKMDTCKSVCANPDASIFEKFEPIIRSLLELVKPA